MKSIQRIAIILSAIAFFSVPGQSQILKKMKERVAQTAEQRVLERTGEATEKSMDEVEKGSKGKKENKENKDENRDQEEPAIQGGATTPEAKNDFMAYSKFDFIPGEKTIFFEDFATDVVGDFPARWNTNVSGEVMTTTSAPGKWFRMKAGGAFIPDGITDLPDNFTIEFDVIMAEMSEYSSYWLNFDLYGGKAQNNLDDSYPGDPGLTFQIGNFRHKVFNMINGESTINSAVDDESIVRNYGKPHRVSIWRQKQRVRLYVNERKIFDLPRVLPPNAILQLLRFNTAGTLEEENLVLVSNIRVAIGAPDMRSKLITEGKLVTQGILFGVNSDKIKPESAGTLKSIATVLKENPSIKVTITGHTDSDGEENFNLSLSKKRAEAVKKALAGEYGIDASRMETEGKGESNPIADNKTPEGKANNRRVEFVKR